MRWVLMISLLATGLVMGRGELPLPVWDEEERAEMLESGWMAGGLLLNFEAEPEEELLAEIEEPTPEELVEAAEDESEVAERFLAEYFELRPSGRVVDPQGLLTSRERRDLDDFLRHHGGDSLIDLYVYVFGADQRIPSDVREEEVVERLYSVGKPAVVIYYFLGVPQRSVVYLSPVIRDTVSAAEQHRALESSVMQAFGDTKAFEQLEAFLVQMSIRIYWMERMIAGTAVETRGTIPGGERESVFSERRKVGEVPAEIPSWVKFLGAVVVSGLGGLLALVSAVMWWRGWARFRFPEFEVEPRLGGSHAAGIGAMISFGSASVPPAMQRKQVPNYIRRA